MGYGCRIDNYLTNAHPQTASFGPERRFRSFEILDVARYASGLKIAQALLWTKIYHLGTDTNYYPFTNGGWR